MKLLCITLFLAAIHQHDCKATISSMKSAEYACYKQTGIKKEDVPELGNFEITTDDTLGYRKMLQCIFTQMGILDGQGIIDSKGFDNFVKVIIDTVATSPELKKLVPESLEQCRTIEGETGGEIGLKLKNCIRTAGADLRQKVASLSTLHQ
ncbi:hypothetical protein PPYR_00821 [Photinus pyralis]|uniref:Uncharacterized protein n=1 Tax=Photinus pyralis TaxID=7054 RepID=A0A1Y1MEE8_PHOPY|nr:hypothetical protein PPYR_00821 [Photinus pyralis]